MHTRRSWSRLGAAFAACLLVSFTARAAGPDDSPCKSGTAHGKWQLPSAQHDKGAMKGELVDDAGVKRFVVAAKLKAAPTPFPTPVPPPHGKLKGQVWKVDSDAPGDGAFAWLMGVYDGTATGQGKFEAAMIQFSPITNQIHVVGKLVGKYDDPQVTPMPSDVPGKFKGNWKVCQ